MRHWSVLLPTLALVLPACGEARSNAAAPAPRPAATGSAVLLACPTMLAAGAPLPTGGRLVGKVSGAALPLREGSLAGDDPATADPARGLDTVEAESLSAGRQVYSYTPDSASSLVCRYGKVTGPLLAEAVLLLKLPAVKGICTFVEPRAGKPGSMACMRDRRP